MAHYTQQVSNALNGVRIQNAGGSSDTQRGPLNCVPGAPRSSPHARKVPDMRLRVSDLRKLQEAGFLPPPVAGTLLKLDDWEEIAMSHTRNAMQVTLGQTSAGVHQSTIADPRGRPVAPWPPRITRKSSASIPHGHSTWMSAACARRLGRVQTRFEPLESKWGMLSARWSASTTDQ